MKLAFNPARSFLTLPEIPPNLLRVRLGDRVEVVAPRRVVRNGYRLTCREADIDPAAQRAAEDAFALAFGWSGGPPRTVEVHLRNAARALWAHQQGYGGPERGVVVEEAPEVGGVWEVLDRRTTVVGTRHGGFRGSDWFGYEDAEGPCLHPSRVVLQFRIADGWVLSGDCRIPEGA